MRTAGKGGRKMSEKPKYYITTAIAYTSGKPHIGNTYEIVLADAIARSREARDMMYSSRREQMSTDRRSSSKPRRLESHQRNS